MVKLKAVLFFVAACSLLLWVTVILASIPKPYWLVGWVS